MMIRRLLIAAGLLLALAGCKHHGTGGLRAEDAWIREAPPGVDALAGYVNLHNDGGRELRCDQLEGVDFDRAEIHRTVTANGQSKMLTQQTIVIPAHGEARIQPGGYHLMLMHPHRRLKAGDTTRLTLGCGNVELDATFTVRSNP